VCLRRACCACCFVYGLDPLALWSKKQQNVLAWRKPLKWKGFCLLFCLRSRSACALVEEATKRPRVAQAIEMKGFTFKKLPNCPIKKTKWSVFCRCERSDHHRSTSSLKHHLMMAKQTYANTHTHTHTHTQRWCEFSTPSPISGPRQYFFHPFTDRQCYIVWEIIYYVSVKLSTIPMLFSILIIKKNICTKQV